MPPFQPRTGTTPELGALVVHGMGVQQSDFATPFIEDVRARLAVTGDADAVAWRACDWADILDPREAALWALVHADGTLHYEGARRFIVSYFGDAIAYQRQPGAGTDVYRRVHARVQERLAALRASIGDADRPLVIVAHSLGTVVVSNYIWDEQRPAHRARGATAFERAETLAGFVTMGSPIPLFTLALDEIVPITFPPLTLPPALAAAATWLNLLDADDVLAYPLRGLGARYAAAVSEDRLVNVGTQLTSWNPLSHTGYWGDADVLDAVTALLCRLLAATRAEVA